LFEFEECNYVAVHELCSYWSAHENRKLLSAHCHILFNLNDVNSVLRSFSLDREYKMGSPFVDTNVNFIGLDLTNTLNKCSEMVLK